MSDILSNVTWSDIRWYDIKKNVSKVQYRIYKACLKGNFKQLQWLQNFLVANLGAKLIAIKYAALSTGKKKPDNAILQIITQKEIELAQQLQLKKSSLCKQRTFVQQGLNKNRLRDTFTLTEANYILARLALDPESKALSKTNSLAFRSMSNHVEAIKIVLHILRTFQSLWVYKINVNSCLEKINKDNFPKQLQHLSPIKNYVLASLELELKKSTNDETSSYYVEVDPTQSKSVLSIVSRIFLEDLQKRILQTVFLKKDEKSLKSCKLELIPTVGIGIRYNAELLILHPNRDKLEICLSETKKWFSELGLHLTDKDYEIRQSSEGFTFLGFQIIQVKIPNSTKSRIKVYPSRNSQAQLLSKVRHLLQHHKSVSSYELIRLIRPIILCWGNYFKYFTFKPTFQKLTHLIFQKLRAWVFRRDTKNGRQYVKEKYFPSHKIYTFNGVKHQSNWVLVGRKKDPGSQMQETFLPHLSWIRSSYTRDFTPIEDLA